MMVAPNEYVTIDVNGYQIDSWKEYSIDSDMMDPASNWTLMLGLPVEPSREEVQQFEELRDLLTAGSEVSVYIGSTRGDARPKILQLSGILETRRVDRQPGRGTTIHIEGRDKGAHLVSSDIPIDFNTTNGFFASKYSTEKFLDIVRAAVSPWDITVVTDNTSGRNISTGKTKTAKSQALDIEQAAAFGIPKESFSRSMAKKAENSGMALDDLLGLTPDPRLQRRSSNGMAPGDVERIQISAIKPNPGESVWDFLWRQVEHLKLWMWFSADGKLIVSSPNYNQPPLHRLIRRYKNDDAEPNNIKGGGEKTDGSNLYSTVKVYGKVRGDDATKSKYQGIATNGDVLPFQRLLVIHDFNIDSDDEAEDMAKRELSRFQLENRRYIYTVQNHGIGDHLFAVDTMIKVIDEVAGINEDLYCIARRFQNNIHNGATTRLELIPSGSLLP